MSSDASPDQYLILAKYQNDREYSSYQGVLPIAHGVCPTLADAAVILVRKRIQDLQKIVDDHNAGKSVQAYVPRFYVVKVPVNVLFEPTNLSSVPITSDMVPNELQNELDAVQTAYEDVPIANAQKNTLSVNGMNNNNTVDRSVYLKDRLAKEYEHMQRNNIKPMYPNRAMGGRVPTPAANVSVRPVSNVTNPKTTNTTTAKAVATPTRSAPASAVLPAPVPNATENVNGINNNVVSPTAIVDNASPVITTAPTVNNSQGEVYTAPPNNTGSSPNSRVIT